MKDSLAKSYISCAVFTEKSLPITALRVKLLTTPPTASHGPLLCQEPKKFRQVVMLKSNSENEASMKGFLDLNCPAQPSVNCTVSKFPNKTCCSNVQSCAYCIRGQNGCHV